MKNPLSRHRFDEFTVLEVFLVVTLFGILSGYFFSVAFPGTSPVPVIVAPTSDEYRATVSGAMLPFLSALSVATAESVVADSAPLKELATAAHQEMLAIRVPADQRTAHLEMVLLLDRWNRALSGNESDMAGLLAKTQTLIENYPWLAGAPASTEEDIAI